MMNSADYKQLILVADEDAQTRRLIIDVLRGIGFENVMQTSTGDNLLNMAAEFLPRVVITSSRIPGMSGLEFTRLVRVGYKNIPRDLKIIAMTNTPTIAFLEAARNSGVDELLVRPVTAGAVRLKIRAVIETPREFIDSIRYKGPCRRRRQDPAYDGPRRRFLDPTGDQAGAAPWETEPNKVAVRKCVRKISELMDGVSDIDRMKLRSIYQAAKEAEDFADEVKDKALATAAKSLGHYIMSNGSNGQTDPEVVATYIDAMHSLSMLTSAQFEERQKLIEGLEQMVAKKLSKTREPDADKKAS